MHLLDLYYASILSVPMRSGGGDERLYCLVPSLLQELVPAILSDPAPPNELNEVPAAAAAAAGRLLDGS